ncbi:hypothetical protein SAMN05216464_103422 [Mucilaginibacter pineti]|uniref:Glycosyl transferase family 8 n=1 Tax=Mucilaginibacter pineti TaxID=1391627 RepID=A0A1G6ZLZ4_9SPHI|nr:hypothetical protein [Mucilaginibacter pineti]SDE03844.1 hypothetical protein SAMN05216464_103422 [Mucilaginibacter pineti]
MKERRQVITIATGKKLYVDFAVNLARSFFLWHTGEDINFQLVTDLPELVPRELLAKIELITTGKGEIGEGFSPKLHLDKLISDGHTLFIDSDCLIYRNLDFVFEQFRGHHVSVIGNYICKGEWFGDVAGICTYFGIKEIPKFNGGIYYLESGAVVDNVYAEARRIEKIYDQAGFVRLRNRPNDEVILAVAMQLNQQVALPEDGSIMAEFVNFRSGIKSNLFQGVAELYNTPQHRDYVREWPLTVAKPAIVHFLGHHNQMMPYIREAALLANIVSGSKAFKKRMMVQLTVVIPHLVGVGLKNLLRPMYHAFFGARKIRKSERIID